MPVGINSSYLARAKTQFVHNFSVFVNQCRQHGITIGIRCGYRTPSQQTALYSSGRSRPGSIVTNARAWHSPHNFSLANDIILVLPHDEAVQPKHKVYKLISEIAKNCNLESGLYFKGLSDPLHIQLRGWKAKICWHLYTDS